MSEIGNRQIVLDQLYLELSRCRRCVEAGYTIGSRPIFSGPAGAQIMVVGQAPAKVEEGEQGQPFGLRRGGQRSLLWTWLEQAGWSEAEFRARHYFSAVTKCYPGRSKNSKGDRVPTATERRLCASWRERELAILRPKIIIVVGRIAIETFLPELKGRPLEAIIGHIFERPGITFGPLPHPSGVSRWLNEPGNQARVEKALARLRGLKEKYKL